MAITIQLRRDTAANFNSANTVPAAGEILLATDTHQAVIGDGSGQDFEAMVTANKFFRFEDGDGGRVFGGNEANETITIKGNSTQTVPIFKVVNSSDQSIVEVTDNDTQLVKIDSTNADVGDINLLLKAKASQTGEVIVVTDSDDDKTFTVKEDGQTLIDCNDTSDPSLDVRGGSGNAAGIFRVANGSNSEEFKVSDTGVTVAGTLGVTGESTFTDAANFDGTLKVDDITEHTADHGIDIAKPISVTGNITGSSNLVIPNQPCQTRITQTKVTAEYPLVGNSDATLISFTEVTQMAVQITPAVAGSKILIELSCMAGDDAFNSNSERPEALIGTLFRQVGSGSKTDLSDANSATGGLSNGIVKGLFFTTCTRFDGRGSVPASLNILGQHLDTPTYSLGDQLTYSLGIASFHDTNASGNGINFQLNQIDRNSYHNAQAQSLIKVTEIPQ